MQTAIPCTMMRGGTSKGAYFLASDLPADTAQRDKVLLAVMGSPDPRQIDGIGGADPLTSKIGIISKSSRPGIDVDYLFAQAFVDKPLVSTAQNCGNILAGVGPFAIEHGLVKGGDPETRVTIFMVNSNQTVVATIQTPGGTAHLPGRRPHRRRAGHGGADLALILGRGGLHVRRAAAHRPRRRRDRRHRRHADRQRHAVRGDARQGPRPHRLRDARGARRRHGAESPHRGDPPEGRADDGLGDVKEKSVPKMFLVAPPRAGGVICTRSYIPHRAHAGVGVFAALSVATACLLPDSPAHALAKIPAGPQPS